MTEQLDRVKARRKAHRSVVTRLVNEATPILEGEITDKLLTRLRIIDGQLEDKGRLLSSFDEEIIALIDVAEIEADILESETVSDKIAQMRGEIKVVLESREAPAREENTSRSVSPTHSVRSVESDARDDHSTDPLAPVDRHSETRSPTTPESRSAGIKPKLPKLQLPKFAGDVTKFRTFWDSFDSAINQNADLSPIDKFSYLKTLVEGPAAHAIQGLTLSEANYAAAIELIKERFGKPQQIISAHIDELLKLPSCSDDNAIQIRSVFDRIRVNARGLESLGVGSDQYGSFMIPIIMAKLPPAVRLQVARVTTRDVWNMDELLEVIKSEVEARELSEGIRVGEMKKPESVNRRPPIPTASALVTREGGPSRIKCVYCRGEHYSASCDKVNTVSARTEVLKKEGRCFLCLSNGHRASQCTSNKRCRKCGRKHHQSICVPSKPVEEKETTTNTGKETTTNLVRTKTCVLLQTARTYAYTSDENLIPVRLLMDNGSQRSYISNQLRSKLKLSPLRRERLTLNTFGNEQFNKKECDLVRIRLQTRFEEDLEVMALTFPAICSPLRALVEVEQYSHLHDLDLADVDSSDDHPSDAVDILIGSDYYWDAVIGDVARGKGGPVAVKSKFGWLLSGPVRPTLAENNHTVSNLILEGPGETGLPENNDIKLVDNLRQFWDTEAIGISPEFKEIANDSSFIEIRFDWQQQRYQVNLPWKTECRPQSNCYEMCVARLHQLRVRLQKDKDLFHEYNSIFESQLHDGIIERIPDTKQSSLCHYLPHHGVRRVDKETTKLRIVFNGSAKADRRLFSLNDCLNKGPNRIPHIFDMLLKFRSYPIGIIADIEKAFHQILIDPSDRDMLRFLWLDDIHKDRPGIVQYRFCRLVFGLTPSPAILTETIQYHLTRYLLTEPLRVKQLAESFYVDDFISGVCADDGGFNLYQKAKEIMRAGGFNLRKWKTNSPTLQKRINEAERSSGTPATHGSEQETVKILGLNWDCKADGLYFDLTEVIVLAKSLPPTRRSILSLSAKLFDPLGLLSPFIIGTKILFQILCKDKVGWDEELKGNLLKRWNRLVSELEALSTIKVPRCYYLVDEVLIEQQVHGFCDASERAYAAAIYLRSVYRNGDVKVCLISSKTRVAPLKRQTIPRLELLGATILARLINVVMNCLTSNPEMYCWTDSHTVLCWIKNDRPWRQYVRHRVDEIRKLTHKEVWRYCPGTINPADIASRSCSGQELVGQELWWRGPEFLRNSSEGWPNLPTQYESEAADKEIVKSQSVITHSLVSLSQCDDTPNLSDLVDVKRYSSKLRLLRVTGWVLKFVAVLKAKDKNSVTCRLEADDLKRTETMWIRHIQRQCFVEEHNTLVLGKAGTVVYKNQLLFMNDLKLICCKSRLEHADLPVCSKNPVLLPSKHRFTELLIMETHQLVHHNGIQETLSAIRERYWIIRGREAVKKVVRRCVLCRKHEGNSYATPPVPPLPVERVSNMPPFNNTGLDFAGPLYVRDKLNGATDNQEIKVYVCLFTCASSRGLHLELTRDLSATVFLQAFRKFCARRGVPSTIMSDNAKTFKCCSKEVERVVRSEEVHQYLTNRQISWQFIVEKAPWWGGYWERMVRSVKRCLRKTLGRSTLTFDELGTVLVEIEATLNNRPLTYVYDDNEGLSYALTPADLIYGHRLVTSPSGRQFEVTSTAKTLTRRYKYQFRLLNNFVKKWQQDYLLSLQEKGVRGSKSPKQQIKTGDIVILRQDGTPRCLWKLAKVVELFKGRDEKIRSARVQLLRKDKVISLRRPIQHLIPLECH